ncbi:helix-turn-helix domain-containing protein [Shimia sp. SDUM112013]|uniref:helix-turn-helix domain-containing protein n=1 Tax=Shimia sp. SDUM112013 TaxID=3136160 RepID=UPI0032EBD9BD
MDAHPAPKPASLQEIRSRSWERLARVSPVLEAHQTQLGPGDFSVDGVVARANEVWLIKNRLGPLSVGNIVPDPNVLAFLVPVKWQGDFRFNGTSSTNSTIFLGSGPDGYMTRGTGREYFNIGLDRGKFLHALAALEGVHPGEIVLHDGAITIPEFKVVRLRQVLQTFLNELSGKLPSTWQRQTLIAENLYGVMLEAYLAGVPTFKTRRPRAMSHERIVRIAEEHFASANGAAVSLVDLCNATGVGRTVFYEAFAYLFGVSPLRYFKHRRLMQARESLMAPSTPNVQVKDIALSLGLTHLGRFSTEYRTLFGENPSSTLLNGREDDTV